MILKDKYIFDTGTAVGISCNSPFQMDVHFLKRYKIIYQNDDYLKTQQFIQSVSGYRETGNHSTDILRFTLTGMN